MAKKRRRQPTTTTNRFLGVDTESDSKKTPHATVLYGPPGVGKSSMLCHIPSSCAVAYGRERQRLTVLRDGGMIPEDYPILPALEEWDDIEQVCLELITQPHDYEALVVETVGGLEQLAFAQCCKQEFSDKWDLFYKYSNGPKTSGNRYFPLLLSAFDKLRLERGMSIWLTAHATTKPEPNPSGTDFLKYTAACDKSTWEATQRWADEIIFYDLVHDTKTVGVREKADSVSRMLVVGDAPYAVAKNSYAKMPNVIPITGSTGKEVWEEYLDAVSGNAAFELGGASEEITI